MDCHARVVYHEWYGRRGFTALRQPWNRYHVFLATLSKSALQNRVSLVNAPAVTENELLTIHSAEYVDRIQHMDISGQGRLDGSTPAWRGMYARAERVVGGTTFAAKLITSGQALHVFNPAGGQHHAHQDRGGGFCVFNDVVAAVRHFQARGLQRVAIVDIDGHHGDGTESLLHTEQSLTVSLHQFGDRTYPGTGRPRDIGTGNGRGYALNVPLARFTGSAAYMNILQETVEPLLRAYRPDVLIVEFGTDGHNADPMLRLRLSTPTYRRVARWMHELAHELCEGRLLVVGGGGYDPEHVVRCWILMLAEVTDLPPEFCHPDAELWLSESVPASDPEADLRSLEAAEQARRAVFPFHGIPI